MNFPKELKILGHHYKIKLIEGLTSEGSYSTEKSTILINADLPESQRWSTLFHEILHTVNSELSETDVEFLSQILYCILKDNKYI